jgi:putative transposase
LNSGVSARTSSLNITVIVRILKETEAGISVTELCRKYGISDATYYNWKAKFGGMELSDVRRLKQLEEENRRLKTIVADLTLDNQALKAVVGKNF